VAQSALGLDQERAILQRSLRWPKAVGLASLASAYPRKTQTGLCSSFRRKPESILLCVRHPGESRDPVPLLFLIRINFQKKFGQSIRARSWIPAFAGMTSKY
jgi:hypothetical protein